MKEEKLGQEPAFPLPSDVGVNYCLNRVIPDPANGMSKRFYAACAAMLGLFANPHPIFVNAGMESLIKQAYYAADELLRQEGEL
ncbi:hypothetical protein DSECCO2_604270 [anaerobic digester metagenome]